MPARVRIAIVGDRDPANPNHAATEEALEHAAAREGFAIAREWFATDALCGDAALERAAAADGVWCTTGSPYRSLEGSLRAIRAAREGGIPFLGTCGGFQHSVLEYARNLCGFGDAAHAEYPDAPEDALITPLACSLAGGSFEVELDAGSRAARCYSDQPGAGTVEDYYCSYGIAPEWEKRLRAAGLPIVGSDPEGSPRVLELPDHPFFIATLFVPQARSRPGAPHPLVNGFVRACAVRASRRD